MNRFNNTLGSALDLVREEDLIRFNSSARSKRALLPIIGDWSKSLLGTATQHDVKSLAAHIKALHKQDEMYSTGFQCFGHHFQSITRHQDARLNNAFTAITDNHAAIEELGAKEDRTINYLLKLLTVFKAA